MVKKCNNKIKLAKDIPIKNTISDNDYFLASGVITRNNLRTNKDFLIKGLDLTQYVRSKNQQDAIMNYIKDSPNIKVQRNGDSIYLYYEDDVLNSKIIFLIEQLISLTSVVNSFIASKTASFGDALDRQLNTEQFIRDEITNQVNFIKDSLIPKDIIDIYDANDSNVEINQINGRLTLNINEDAIGGGFSFDEREASIEFILSSTLFQLSIAHLDLTPSCEPKIIPNTLTNNVNGMIAFNHYCYASIPEYQYRVKDLILKLAYQQTTPNNVRSFEYRSENDTGYFEILANSQYYVARRDLQNATFLDKVNSICRYRSEANIFIFGSTILFGIHSKSFNSTPSSYYFSIFSFFDEDKITLHYNNDMFILDIAGSITAVSTSSLNKSKNINIGISFDLSELTNSVILQLYQDGNVVESKGIINKNIFTKIIDANKKYIAGFIADQTWYCSGVTIFSDGLTSNLMTNYLSQLY